MDRSKTENDRDRKEIQREFQVLAKPVGSRCNLHCRYCYYRSNEHTECSVMTDELLKAYILQHIDASTGPLIPFSWHGGEPTLFGLERFRRIVALQKKFCPSGRRIVNGIQTNGTHIDDDWCRFMAAEHITVGLSMDGPEPMHDLYRLKSKGEGTFQQVCRSYDRLRKHGVQTECLCVVHSGNVCRPREVYEFFLGIEVPYLTFLPLVEPISRGRVSSRSVTPEGWGIFLCSIFDMWESRDIGRIKIQIFEEAARTAFGLEHTLCIFRKTCGGVPALECNGDLYSCDHFTTSRHRLGNIRETSLVRMLDSPRQQSFGEAKKDTLPGLCLDCPELDMCNGGCPKNRFIQTPDGESGLNYLCAGYKRFFSHCRPFVDAVARLHREKNDSY